MSVYLVVKFVHVFTAIVAIGGATGWSLVQRLAMRDPTHLVFAVRSSKLLDRVLFGPGLLVLLITGLWMAATNWSLALFWVRAALIIVVIVLVLIYGIVGPNLGRLAHVLDADGPASPNRQQPERMAYLVGLISSILIVVLIWLMVIKPL